MTFKVKVIEKCERKLTFAERCMLSISLNENYTEEYRKAAKDKLSKLGIDRHEWDCVKNESGYYGCTGYSRKETIRDATTEEIQAFLMLKYYEEVCANGPKKYCNQEDNCFFSNGNCPITSVCLSKFKNILKDKEVFEE